MLWVDAVGGYWLTLADSIVLGQPVAPERDGRQRRGPDLAILGDLHARHARIRRDEDGYLIEAIHSVAVDGRPVQKVATLVDGSVVTLGRNVRLRFRRPHPLSGTARLELLGQHRTEPRADGVLLMADTCVLGPKPVSHVLARHWTHDVVLSRRGSELYCRAPGTWRVNGEPCEGHRPIGANARIAGETFSMCLESVGATGRL